MAKIVLFRNQLHHSKKVVNNKIDNRALVKILKKRSFVQFKISLQLRCYANDYKINNKTYKSKLISVES